MPRPIRWAAIASLDVPYPVVIDNDFQHPPQEKTGAVKLSAGLHRIRVSYFQGPKFQIALVLKVAGPGQEQHVFSTDEFKPPPDAGEWRVPVKIDSPAKN